MDHASVLQVIDQTFAASSIISNGKHAKKIDDNERQRRNNRAREVWRWINLRALQYRGMGTGDKDILVKCPMALEKTLRDWGLPANVDISHFNADRGSDIWGGVRCIIIVGRLAPEPDVIEAIAEALTGHAVSNRAPTWYPQATVGIRMRDGTGS